MTSGIHHITLITRKVQANVDFYAGFLGLRLVKRTGGYEDAEQLHLFYGDSEGSPGSLLTFFAWEDGAPGRSGLGQVGEIALAVPTASIGFWLTRALRYNLKPQGPSAEFGEPVLRLTDPDGIVVKIVGTDIQGGAPPWSAEGVSAEDAVRRIRGVTLFTDVPDQTSAFLANFFGYRHQASAGTIERMVSESGDIVDVRNASGFWPGAPGPGAADHVAFRVPDRERLEEIERRLRSRNSSVVNVHDRKYYYSLYVREPGNILFELATDGPGLTVDEPLETLGSRLMIPPERQKHAEEIKVMLPQFAMPGEERIRYVELPFVHRFYQPPDPDGSTIVLLHGSGGTEADLMPMATRISPRATLLGVRGRATEEGIARWFRRDGIVGFDQEDVRSEAAAFEAFVEGLVEAYGLDPDKMTFIGYSNGANFLLAAMQLHRDIVHRAVALRPIGVLDEAVGADLSGKRILVVLGKEDALFHQRGDELFAELTRLGADTALVEVPLGHELGDADIEATRRWVASL